MNDDIIQDFLEPPRLEPFRALILYRSSSHRTLDLVSYHHVEPGRGSQPAQLDAGRPLSQSDERDLIALLQGRDPVIESDAFIPPGLLAEKGDRRLLWHRPAKVRPMHLLPRTGKRASVTVLWPNLVFKAVDDDIALAALAPDAEPTPDAPLYHAPLPNLYDDGLLCLGDAPPPVTQGREAIPEWDGVVFDTTWTHSNTNLWVRKPAADGPSAFWLRRAKSAQAKQPIPAGRLQPMGCSLGEWWRA